MFRCTGKLPRWIVCGLIVAVAGVSAPADSVTADAVYKATGVQGGLVVHLGCGNGKLTGSLRVNERYLVHGLDTDQGEVAKTRELLRSKGLYGPVSANCFDGKNLPYVRNTVNLLIAEERGEVTMDEIFRVLVPKGVAYLKQGDKWKKKVKPRPGNMDEWTHFLHDSGGNAVADDTRISPPDSIRWLAGPRHCRSHEFPSSVNGVVTSGGRIFTILDEAPCGVYEKLPQNCNLIARDAFNGVLLWKVPLRKWDTKFGTGRGGRWHIHHTIPRRLVAKGDRVYVTLSFLNSPVSVLNAATGEIITEALPGTKGTDEMLLSEGILIAKITGERSPWATTRVSYKDLGNTLLAVDVKRGKQLWRKEGVHVAPYALAAKEGSVVYHNLRELVSLDAKTGREKWRTAHEVGAVQSALNALVIKNGVVLYDGSRRKKLTAFSLEDGAVLWQRKGQGGLSGACTQPAEIFVANGTVWYGTSLQGYGLRTGEVTKELELANLITPGHHRRCMRAKATVRYIIRNKRGAEFVDLQGDGHMRYNWIRTPCFTGCTPANGMFYAPPDQCFCYPGVKVPGYLAMASDPVEELKASTESELKRGHAYGKVAKGRNASKEDWPMYRREIQRSGSTKTTVPGRLKRKWEVELSCPGTQPVIVGGRLWVVEKGAHRIRCLDSASGKDIWQFTSGGPVDSPPTVRGGMVLFGCRDGSVYCLRASDGELVWRFRAAPEQRRIVSYGQLESVWPVQGSVLFKDGKVYFAAGRSSFLNGGIIVYALDAETGKVLHHHILKGPWPDIKTEKGRPFAMEGALQDLFVSDGKDLYMMRIKFDPELNRLETRRGSPLGELDMGANHLVATGGFLDDSAFDRIYWMYSERWPGFYFAQQAPKSGQLVVFDDSTTYAVKYFYRRRQWSPIFYPEEDGYLLFADDNDNQPTFLKEGKKDGLLHWLPEEARTDRHRRGGRGVEKGTGYVRQKPAEWQKMVPVRIRAMVLAGNRLFAAGPEDRVDPKDPFATFEGRTEAMLRVFSAKDGSLLSSQKLKSMPVFDGLSAARGRLYMATTGGKVVCYGE